MERDFDYNVHAGTHLSLFFPREFVSTAKTIIHEQSGAAAPPLLCGSFFRCAPHQICVMTTHTVYPNRGEACVAENTIAHAHKEFNELHKINDVTPSHLPKKISLSNNPAQNSKGNVYSLCAPTIGKSKSLRFHCPLVFFSVSLET